MNIGFDAKRAFHNSTGLGNYSRTLIKSFSNNYPQHKYFLFNPKKGKFFQDLNKNMNEIRPTLYFDKLFPAIWRSKGMVRDINKHVQLFHGLSNELPFGIHTTNVKKVVTIHDLIYEFYPKQYKSNDIAIYRKKFKYACEAADSIIAISESTKQDLIDVYHVPQNKIEVCYQSCDPNFFTSAPQSQKQLVTQKYNLHKPYFLSVGSIIERKNLLQVCKAFCEVKRKNDVQLIVIGKGKGDYKKKVLAFIQQKKLSSDIIFLEDIYSASEILAHLPTIYQMALAFIYPSIKEGFGIPVLESMASGTPVITSNQSSLKEAGGNAAILVNPLQQEEIEQAMLLVLNDESNRKQLIKQGYQQAQLFTNEISCNQVMQVYKKLIPTL